MKNIKKLISLTLLCFIFLGALSGCVVKNEKITVVCTIFPIYDWARQVVGDSDTIELKLLVSDGADLHSFQPTAADAIAIRTADIIIRVGGVDDGFVNDLLEESKNTDLRLSDAEGVTLRHSAESSEHSHDDGHDHIVDEHIWLSLNNAMASVEAICAVISTADPENADLYRQRADTYIESLAALDLQYRQVTEEAQNPRVVFADRFPFIYLTSDYNIEYAAAFEGCTTDAEAGFDTILDLSQTLNEWELSYLCVTETSDRRLYDAVCETVKDRQISLAVFDSMQSVKKVDVESGETYLGIMKKNLKTLATVFGVKEI